MPAMKMWRWVGNRESRADADETGRVHLLMFVGRLLKNKVDGNANKQILFNI